MRAHDHCSYTLSALEATFGPIFPRLFNAYSARYHIRIPPSISTMDMAHQRPDNVPTVNVTAMNAADRAMFLIREDHIDIPERLTA